MIKRSAVYTLIHGLACIVCILQVLTVNSRADTCTECHTNPKYKKEDMTRLKQCLACHGSADHPYKPTAKGSAEAAERGTVSKQANSPQERTAIKKPDLKNMVLIREGEFLMGTDDRWRDEKPLYVVYLKAFYIDTFEVTNEDYQKFVESTGHPAPDNWKKNTYPSGKGKHPVIFVDWHDAGAYCRWAGKRLPRETEWEKAARGTDGRIFPWGNVFDKNKSNNPIRAYPGTMPIGSFEKGKGPYGLYDMSGNVWEWVDDYYLPHPGSDYISPEFGMRHKMLKGGSWWDCMFYGCGISAPTYNRAFFDPTTKSDSYGFRCIADAGEK